MAGSRGSENGNRCGRWRVCVADPPVERGPPAAIDRAPGVGRFLLVFALDYIARSEKPQRPLAEVAEAPSVDLARGLPDISKRLGSGPSLKKILPASIVRMVPGIIEVELQIGVFHQLDDLIAK